MNVGGLSTKAYEGQEGEKATTPCRVSGGTPSSRED